MSYFPSNQFDPATDYGRSTFDVHHRFLSGGNYQGLFGVSISPFVVLDSGTPFNITTGQDLNGDNQFNDRPAFATDRSTNIVKTKYGSFTLLPSAFEPRIPYNLGNGPRPFSTNLRISKSFGLGPGLNVAAGTVCSGTAGWWWRAGRTGRGYGRRPRARRLKR